MGARKLESDKQIAESIVKKIVSVSGEEGLEKFLKTNGEDMPAVKLTTQEMEFLKGGVTPIYVAGAYCIDKGVKIGRKIASWFE